MLQSIHEATQWMEIFGDDPPTRLKFLVMTVQLMKFFSADPPPHSIEIFGDDPPPVQLKFLGITHE